MFNCYAAVVWKFSVCTYIKLLHSRLCLFIQVAQWYYFNSVYHWWIQSLCTVVLVLFQTTTVKNIMKQHNNNKQLLLCENYLLCTTCKLLQKVNAVPIILMVYHFWTHWHICASCDSNYETTTTTTTTNNNRAHKGCIEKVHYRTLIWYVGLLMHDGFIYSWN